MKFIARLFAKEQKAPATPSAPISVLGSGIFSTHSQTIHTSESIASKLEGLQPKMAAKLGTAMDADDSFQLKLDSTYGMGANQALIGWYGSHGFIGHPLCAIMAQQWLVNKACSVPAVDATRNGWEVASVDGEELSGETRRVLSKYEKKYKVKQAAQEFIHFGRVFGIRIALFKVRSSDANYYSNPFNIDGVEKGAYEGIAQIDPYWCTPEFAPEDLQDPTQIGFYEPTHWTIRGKKYHRSHMVIMRNGDVPDVLKPAYQYGGIPVPQLIMERVYSAERTANEGCLLAMSKRTTVWLTEMADLLAKGDDGLEGFHKWLVFRDNHQVKVGQIGADSFQQFDTALGDLDSVIFNQYQLVAAAANIPATKLLGTPPKGFNATGEAEMQDYRVELEGLQAKAEPLIERHTALVMKSFMGGSRELAVAWNPLDAPTGIGLANLNLVKAQIGAALVGSGAIDAVQERARIANDKDSGYHAVGVDEEDAEMLEDLGYSNEALSAAIELGVGR
jgi:hypothetical protein